jgi:hypothetical protein
MPPRIPDLAKIRQIIPPLSHELHKGQAGKQNKKKEKKEEFFK